MNRLSILLVLAAGCSWGQFDDLSDQTPVRAQEKPDGVNASDYGVGIANATLPTETAGGRLAVLSSGNGNYSTLDFDASGKSAVGDSEALGIHTIDTITASALLIGDGAGNVAIIDNSNVGTIVAIHGMGTALSVDQQVPTPMHPDAATFAGGRIVIGAGPQSAGGPNLFNIKDGVVNACTAVDNVGPLSATALASDGTSLFVWSKSGAFYTYALTALDPTMPTSPCTLAAPNPATLAMAGAATNGGHIDLAGGFAILTAYDTPLTMTGQVVVVNLTTHAVSAPTIAHGVRSATFGTFGGQGALVLGYPNRTVGTATNAGEIDIHLFDTATGNLTGSPEQTFSNTQADASLTLGRTVTTMLYKGQPVIAASGSNVVYAYLATQLYNAK